MGKYNSLMRFRFLTINRDVTVSEVSANIKSEARSGPLIVSETQSRGPHMKEEVRV